MGQPHRVFRVFYRDYAHNVAIKSTEPQELGADRLGVLAEHLLVSEDNFLGVVDGNDTILQLYLDDDHVIAELIYPDTPGCYRLRLEREDAFDLLGRLPEAFSEELLPGAQYIG